MFLIIYIVFLQWNRYVLLMMLDYYYKLPMDFIMCESISEVCCKIDSRFCTVIDDFYACYLLFGTYISRAGWPSNRIIIKKSCINFKSSQQIYWSFCDKIEQSLILKLFNWLRIELLFRSYKVLKKCKTLIKSSL